MQPKTAGTALYRRLDKLGEHVHHVFFTAEDVNATVKALASAGSGIVEEGISNDPNVPWQFWTFVDPTMTQGVLVELANNYDAVGGKWKLAKQEESVT